LATFGGVIGRPLGWVKCVGLVVRASGIEPSVHSVLCVCAPRDPHTNAQETTVQIQELDSSGGLPFLTMISSPSCNHSNFPLSWGVYLSFNTSITCLGTVVLPPLLRVVIPRRNSFVKSARGRSTSPVLNHICLYVYARKGPPRTLDTRFHTLRRMIIGRISI
jgi:hypothetical protein